MRKIRVLLVPDSIYWVTGTIAKSIAAANPWLEATIISAPVLDEMFHNPESVAERFDLAHFLCPYATLRWLPLLQPFMPVVTSHHHVTSWDLIKHNLGGDAIIVGSQEWADDLLKREGDPTRVFRVPYGVDVDMFSPASSTPRARKRRELALDGQGPVVGFFAKRASNDDDRKGTAVFVDAVMQLHSRIPGTTVLIVGPGWQDLVSRFRERGVRCEWIPFVEDLAGIPELYHALDFYWVTARVEGGPVPLLEAMSSGVCCMSTRVGLAREVVDDGANGFLLAMDDAAAFAQKTEALWNEPALRMRVAAAARATMVEQMRWQDTATLVRPAYARAAENFSARCSGSAVKSAAAGASAHPGTAKNGTRMDALNAAERKRATMLEALAWAENLVLFQHQHGAAVRLILRAWLENPFAVRPIRVILRRMLPAPLVRTIVALKDRLGSRERSKQRIHTPG